MKVCKNKEFQNLKRFIASFSSRAYFVGGCVRDALFGIPCYDFDIEIYDISPQDFDKMMKKLDAKGVGKSFFVYKYGVFDLALARLESKSGFGHRGFEVRVCDDERLASSRRDFTINSLMYDIFSSEILDFHDGLKDLKGRILRITNEQSFKDDSLRVLRAVQFVARFNLKTEQKSLEIMREMDISDLSSERVRRELEKLFSAKFLGRGLRLLGALGLDERLFGFRLKESFIKELVKIRNFTQNPLSVPYEIFARQSVIIKGFESISKQEVCKKTSAKKLLEIALKTPLKNWLGINSKARRELALRLGVMDERLKISLDENELKKLSAKEREKIIKTAKKKAIKERLNDRN